MSELWAEAFTSSIGRIDERQDAERINKAFKKARHTLNKWPSPAQIIDLMPRRPERTAISHEIPADVKKAKMAFKICQDVIAGKISVVDANALLAEEIEDKEIPF